MASPIHPMILSSVTWSRKLLSVCCLLLLLLPTDSRTFETTAAARALSDPPAEVSKSREKFTQDPQCQAYVAQFLNGTTDVKDECKALRYAFDDANCPARSSTMGTNEVMAILPAFLEITSSDPEMITSEDLITAILECCSSMERRIFQRCRDTEDEYAMTIVGIIMLVFFCALAKAALAYFEIGWGSRCMCLHSGGRIDFYDIQHARSEHGEKRFLL